MPFDYSISGLPDNPQWQAAADVCHAWLMQHMSMFGPERIARFMLSQPITAAKLITENCPDWSEECVTLALLGPAKEALLETGDIFSGEAKALFEVLTEKSIPNAAQERDQVRLFLVEGLSTMNDQLIGRARIDQHHQTRWNILHVLEKDFALVQGRNPALDRIFAQALEESRTALQALDKAG
jgi:hypothetical protein